MLIVWLNRLIIKLIGPLLELNILVVLLLTDLGVAHRLADSLHNHGMLGLQFVAEFLKHCI